MIEIILIVYFSMQIGRMATLKGEPKWKWGLRMAGAWMALELLGLYLFVNIFSITDPTQLTSPIGTLMLIFGPICGFGGYLLVRRALERLPNKPDLNDKINQIGKKF